MKIRIRKLWRVPVYCMAASWISFYVTVYLGRFFYAVSTVGEDGSVQLSVDPVRSSIFQAVLIVIIWLIGGRWVFRRMTRTEIAVSAGVISAAYLAATLAQMILPPFPVFVSVILVYLQNWTGMLSSLLVKLTGQLTFSAVASCFAPLLFIPFGRRGEV